MNKYIIRVILQNTIILNIDIDKNNVVYSNIQKYLNNKQYSGMGSRKNVIPFFEKYKKYEITKSLPKKMTIHSTKSL